MESIIIQQVFGMFSEYQSLLTVAPFFYKEINRKFGLTGFVRKLKEDDTDLPESLTGKVCVITGGTRGIGAEVVKVLLKKDCHVITGTSSKSEDDIEQRRAKIMADVPEGRGKLDIWHVDLASMKSVMEFVEKFKATKLWMNYFIANAGTITKDYIVTENGFESQFAINYLSHCLMMWHFLPILADTARVSSEESRIVLVSSCMHAATTMKFNDLQSRTAYSAYHSYAQSKLAFILMTYRLNRYFKDKPQWNGLIKVNSVHPGMTNSDIINNWTIMGQDATKLFPRIRSLPIFRSLKEGSETIIYAALSSEMNGVGGKYLEDSALSKSSITSYNENNQEKLWNITWSLLSEWKNDSVDFEIKDMTFMLYL